MSLPEQLIALKNKWYFFRNEKVTQNQIVILLLPSIDVISGGVMSVVSIYRELKKLEEELRINVFLSTHPQAPNFEGYTKHNRDVKVYGFLELLHKLQTHSTVLFHIPEPHVIRFCAGLRHEKLDRIKKKKGLIYDLNILNQNPDFFPDITDLIRLMHARFRNLTQTTAHYAYNKPFQLGQKTIPSSYLSTYVGIDNSEFIPFENKRNTILVSHDEHEQKEQILETIRASHPDLEIMVVKDMTFEEYTEHQKYCKFGLTFGEGMDFYFVQCILYGGIGFAVNNATFFTDDIRALPTVFDSYEQLNKRISESIKQFNEPTLYAETVKDLRIVLGKYYHNGSYKQRILHLHKNWVNGTGLVATKEILGPS